ESRDGENGEGDTEAHVSEYRPLGPGASAFEGYLPRVESLESAVGLRAIPGRARDVDRSAASVLRLGERRLGAGDERVHVVTPLELCDPARHGDRAGLPDRIRSQLVSDRLEQLRRVSALRARSDDREAAAAEPERNGQAGRARP